MHSCSLSCSSVNFFFFFFILWRLLCWWQWWWWWSSSFGEFSSISLPCSSSSYSSPCSIFASSKNDFFFNEAFFFWSCKFARPKTRLLEKKKTKKKFPFLKESIFGLVDWFNYNFGHFGHGNHMAMTKKIQIKKKKTKTETKSHIWKKIKTKPKLVHLKMFRIGVECPPYN